MDNVIISDKNGTEIREAVFSSYDIEVGIEENSFQIVILRGEFKTIPKEGRIYIPGTEFGGLFRRMETDTNLDTISPGGLTWRGMMQKKIISPPAGQDYATDSGELNEIIKARVEAEFPGMFIGSEEDTGITVNWQYDRYCTLEEGLRKMLKSKGYKLDIAYSQQEKAVVVQAVPIIDYSQQIEMSSDMRLDYYMKMQGDGVNHLICLGSGELKDRDVYHLYVNNKGKIITQQYYFGVDEVAEIFDYAGAEHPDLVQTGKERLEDVMNQNFFQITVEPTVEIAIGDIVGGRDYLSGMTMKAPIAGKIARWENGFRTIEYILEDDVEATITESPARSAPEEKMEKSEPETKELLEETKEWKLSQDTEESLI